jgi:hypothetical protein
VKASWGRLSLPQFYCININIIYLSAMNKNYATLSVGRAVETILDRGAEKLYDKYLEQKLPNHAHNLSDEQFQKNIKMLSLRASKN